MIQVSTVAAKDSPNKNAGGLLDQSALIDPAQRLVEAAKRAGADAADAVAVRGVSQGVEVRDGRVEESERSEGDDVGLRVLVGRRQAVVSTNDASGDAVTKLAERAVAMARVAPDDKYVGLADPALLARDYAFTSAPHGADLLSPDIVGRSAGERTVARFNPRKVETCKVPVVFDPRVAGSLVGHVVGAINGASIARKTSFLKDKLGQQLF